MQKLFKKFYRIPGPGLLVLLMWGNPALLQAAPVKAQLGILVQAAGMQQRASVRQRLRSSDQLQVHVKPSANQIFYLIVFDGQQAKLVHKKALQAGQLAILPGKQTYMQAKRGRPRWMLVLANSPDQRLEAMQQTPLAASRWLMLEKNLLQNGRPVLTDQGKNPTSIAANMRSAEAQVLRSYTGGSSLLALQYKFRVTP